MITAYWPPDVPRRKSGQGLRRTAHRLLLMAAVCFPLAAPAQTQAPTPPAVLSPEGGDEFGPKWLVRLLDRLTPSLDTRLPETGEQIENRLARQIDVGQYAAALDEIEAREAFHNGPGANAQLQFLKARALQGLNQPEAARALYQQMTTDYPELPEPWNNLAVMQAAAGELGAAQDSLRMALRIAPDFQAARDNLKDLFMMQAGNPPADAAGLPHP